VIVGGPRFYFTMHPGDLMRGRIIEGAHIMLVASASWDDERNRFRVTRPPGGYVASICVDSGGFTAARRWGRYPWSPEQYADFAREVSRDVPLDFCAIMDYACEPAVDRSILRTNHERIKATIRNQAACLECAPDLPWLPVLQGDSLAERAFDLALRLRMGMLPTEYAGIGSVCGRGAIAARRVVKFYTDRLPGARFHAFGMHVQALDDDAVFGALRSWDSYAWNWGRGQKDVDRPPECYHKPGESWTEYTARLARFYWRETIRPRLECDRQGVLW
jgi:hypothetical protein